MANAMDYLSSEDLTRIQGRNVVNMKHPFYITKTTTSVGRFIHNNERLNLQTVLQGRASA